MPWARLSLARGLQLAGHYVDNNVNAQWIRLWLGELAEVVLVSSLLFPTIFRDLCCDRSASSGGHDRLIFLDSAVSARPGPPRLCLCRDTATRGRRFVGEFDHLAVRIDFHRCHLVKAPGKVHVRVGPVRPPCVATPLRTGGAVLDPDKREAISRESRIQLPLRHVAAVKRWWASPAELRRCTGREMARNYEQKRTLHAPIKRNVLLSFTARFNEFGPEQAHLEDVLRATSHPSVRAGRLASSDQSIAEIGPCKCRRRV